MGISARVYADSAQGHAEHGGAGGRAGNRRPSSASGNDVRGLIRLRLSSRRGRRPRCSGERIGPGIGLPHLLSHPVSPRSAPGSLPPRTAPRPPRSPPRPGPTPTRPGTGGRSGRGWGGGGPTPWFKRYLLTIDRERRGGYSCSDASILSCGVALFARHFFLPTHEHTCCTRCAASDSVTRATLQPGILRICHFRPSSRMQDLRRDGIPPGRWVLLHAPVGVYRRIWRECWGYGPLDVLHSGIVPIHFLHHASHSSRTDEHSPTPHRPVDPGSFADCLRRSRP